MLYFHLQNTSIQEMFMLKHFHTQWHVFRSNTYYCIEIFSCTCPHTKILGCSTKSNLRYTLYMCMTNFTIKMTDYYTKNKDVTRVNVVAVSLNSQFPLTLHLPFNHLTCITTAKESLSNNCRRTSFENFARVAYYFICQRKKCHMQNNWFQYNGQWTCWMYQNEV